MKKFLLPVGIIVLVAGMVALGAVLSRQEEPGGTLQGAEINAADHVRGNPQAKVQVIEYGDMQCPACASYEPLVEEVISKNSDSIYFAFRHLPLKSIHPNAEEGGWAIEAAHLQGKFWEMKAMMYSGQAAWSTQPDPLAKFQEYAQSLGLDVDRFISDYHSDPVRQKVESDYLTADAAGFNSTPTFVINGQKVKSPQDYDEFVQLINSAAAGTEGQ